MITLYKSVDVYKDEDAYGEVVTVFIHLKDRQTYPDTKMETSHHMNISKGDAIRLMKGSKEEIERFICQGRHDYHVEGSVFTAIKKLAES